MANNCLVEELVGTVNNPNLPVFNSFEVKVKAGPFQFNTGIPNGTVVSFDNDIDDIYLGSVKITSPFTQIYGGGSNGDRWNGTLTKETTFLFKDALYVNRMLKLYGGNDSPQIIHINGEYINSMLYSGVLDELYFPSPITTNGLKLVISDMVDSHINLKSFAIATNSDIEVRGNVADLGNMTNLNTLYLQRRAGFITGRVEGMVAGMSKLGRVSGTLVADLRYDACTFHSLPVEDSTSGILNIEFSSTGATVKDASNNLLATYTKASDTWSYE